MTNSIIKISLIDGRQLDCYPTLTANCKASESTSFIDNSGRYLIIGSRPSQLSLPQNLCDKLDKVHSLFYRHAWLFMNNVDKIMSDSRLFLTKVVVDNGLAITGKFGLQNPTLGVYVEWWTHYSYSSIDADGYPIWYISGSPLSGTSACSSVNREGQSQKAILNTRFRDVWESFMEVNRRYQQATLTCEAYTLHETIDILMREDAESY